MTTRISYYTSNNDRVFYHQTPHARTFHIQSLIHVYDQLLLVYPGPEIKISWLSMIIWRELGYLLWYWHERWLSIRSNQVNKHWQTCLTLAVLDNSYNGLRNKSNQFGSPVSPIDLARDTCFDINHYVTLHTESRSLMDYKNIKVSIRLYVGIIYS